MKQLKKENNHNSPEEYDRIFKERTKSNPNWQDLRRWKELIKYFEGNYLIDIGCLDSQIYDMAHNKVWEKTNGNFIYLGTDVAKVAIKEMVKQNPFSNCFFIEDDIYNTKIRDEVADYVVLGEVLEHLERPEEALKNAFKMLKSGGILAISVPLEEEKEPGAVDGDRHLWSYNVDDIKSLVTPYSLKIEFKVLRSKWFPTYKYCWPQLLCFAWKK